jgi:hypothetical protein
MDTQTLINAIGDIKGGNDKTRKALLGIYDVYSTPFDRITILSMFHEPVNLIWKEDKTVLNGKRVKRHYFSLDNVDYKPKTIADFVSLIDSLERHKLTPKFSGDKSSAALLWNKSRNNNQ